MLVRSLTRLASRASLTRGYTSVEVLLAMTVLMIGTAGVMSMQKAAIQANLDARKLDLANSIAHDWLERISADAMQWTLPASNVAGANNVGNTLYLANSTYPYGQPFLPAIPGSQALAEAQSPAFDILGRGLTQSNAVNAVFCVHVNIVPLAFDSQNNPLLLRATVLVFWPKQLVQSGAIPAGYCTSGSYFDVAAAEAANPGTWHIVYATTGIRKNPI